MKIGLQVPRFHWPVRPENIGSKLAEIAGAADDAGFDSVWVMGHFYKVGLSLGASEFLALCVLKFRAKGSRAFITSTQSQEMFDNG